MQTCPFFKITNGRILCQDQYEKVEFGIKIREFSYVIWKKM
jgi:hypothetical protein